MNKKSMTVLILFMLCFSPTTWAGQACVERPIMVKEFRQAYCLANKLYQHVEASSEQLVLVARIGSDVSEYGLKYTHAGVLLRHHSAGSWLFVHALNRCGTDKAALYNEGLMNFFLDDLFQPEALVIYLDAHLQQAVLNLIRQGLAPRFQETHYSAIAHPFSNDYQNSNGWVLELLAAAQMPYLPGDRTAIHAFLKKQGYQGDEIKVSLLERIGADLFTANVHFDDHPEEADLRRRYKVVSVRSILRYLQRSHTAQTKTILCHD